MNANIVRLIGVLNVYYTLQDLFPSHGDETLITDTTEKYPQLVEDIRYLLYECMRNDRA